MGSISSKYSELQIQHLLKLGLTREEISQFKGSYSLDPLDCNSLSKDVYVVNKTNLNTKILVYSGNDFPRYFNFLSSNSADNINISDATLQHTLIVFLCCNGSEFMMTELKVQPGVIYDMTVEKNVYFDHNIYHDKIMLTPRTVTTPIPSLS